MKFGKFWYTLLLYPEDVEISNVLTLFDNMGFKYYGICHNDPEDLKKSEEHENKVHFHIVVRAGRFNLSIENFSKNTGIPLRFIRQVDNPNYAVQYLTHESKKAKEDNKFIYNRDLIFTNQERSSIDFFYSNSFSDYSDIINDAFLLSKGVITFSDFIRDHPDEYNRLSNLKSFLELYKGYK